MFINKIIKFNKKKAPMILEEDSASFFSSPGEESWLNENLNEGQLSIDVYQTAENIIVKSTIAGVRPEDLDISLHNDMLTIRGKREMEEEINNEHYLCKECFWGSFSRSIILPTEVKAKKIKASIENGVLTVILPKARAEKEISIKVKEL